MEIENINEEGELNIENTEKQSLKMKKIFCLQS